MHSVVSYCNLAHGIVLAITCEHAYGHSCTYLGQLAEGQIFHIGSQPTHAANIHIGHSGFNIVRNTVDRYRSTQSHRALSIFYSYATGDLHILIVGHVIDAHSATALALQGITEHIGVHSAIDVVSRAGRAQIHTDALLASAGVNAQGQACSHLSTAILGQIINIIHIFYGAILKGGICLLL